MYQTDAASPSNGRRSKPFPSSHYRARDRAGLLAESPPSSAAPANIHNLESRPDRTNARIDANLEIADKRQLETILVNIKNLRVFGVERVYQPAIDAHEMMRLTIRVLQISDTEISFLADIRAAQICHCSNLFFALAFRPVFEPVLSDGYPQSTLSADPCALDTMNHAVQAHASGLCSSSGRADAISIRSRIMSS